MACTQERDHNLANAEGLIRAADKAGAQIILPQEVFSLEEIRALRAHWGLFRDRRPDRYGPLLTLDGHTRAA